MRASSDDPDAPRQRRELEDAARALGAKVTMPEVHTPADLEDAIARLASELVDVVVVLQTRMLITERQQIGRTDRIDFLLGRDLESGSS